MARFEVLRRIRDRRLTRREGASILGLSLTAHYKNNLSSSIVTSNA